MKGKLIVLEGIDGCGKSTQINHLATWLPNSGVMPKDANLIITREPGGTMLGNNLRKILLNSSNQSIPQPLTELLLYAADRSQHISEIIVPALCKGDWVISDRFSGSTLAYQGYGRKLDIAIINQLESIATQNIKADLTILLNLNVSESLKRRVKKTSDRMEKEGSEFLSRVSNGFAQISQERQWNTIEANLPCKEVSKNIESLIRSQFED